MIGVGLITLHPEEARRLIPQNTRPRLGPRILNLLVLGLWRSKADFSPRLPFLLRFFWESRDVIPQSDCPAQRSRLPRNSLLGKKPTGSSLTNPPPKCEDKNSTPGMYATLVTPSTLAKSPKPVVAVRILSRSVVGLVVQNRAHGFDYGSHRTTCPSKFCAGTGRLRNYQTSGRTRGGTVAGARTGRRDAAPGALQHPVRAGPGPAARAGRGRGLGRRREQLGSPWLPRAAARVRAVGDSRRCGSNKH